MKAIFMTEIGGKLMEVNRLEVKPTPVYYCAVHEPVSLRILADPTVTSSITPKMEKWVAHSMPNHPNGFAVFLLEGIE